MTTIGRSAATAARVGDSAVLVAVIVALVPMGLLHVAGSAAVDPVGSVISDYVVLSGGYTLIGISSVALAAAGAVLAAGLGAARLPRARTVGGLLLAWSVGLLVVAVFPTNDPGTPVGLTSWVHRFGGAVVFVLLPMIVAVVADRAAHAEHWAGAVPGLRRWAVVTGAGTVVFLGAQLPVAFGSDPALPGIGLMQRLLFAVMMVLLVVLARATRAAADRLPETAPAVSSLAEHSGCGDRA